MRRILATALALGTSLAALPAPAGGFLEMGIPPGLYTYRGHCADSLTATGGLGPASFVFDGRNLNSAKSLCRIRQVDMISAGYISAITTCTDTASGRQSNETYTLLPDQTGKPRIRLEAIHVNGVLTSHGNPDWFHLCRKLRPAR